RHLNCELYSLCFQYLNMEQDNVSPLQHFVVAKRTISAVFHLLLEFVRDCSHFVEETWKSEDLEHVAEEKQCLQIQACSRKLTAIKDMLARRHMKVAFFGRTSNGKSTVINAMLRERVLPSGIGHTTNCFLSVEGTDGEHFVFVIQTVNQLAHTLHMDRNQDSGGLVRVFWPKAKCALLRDDLVLMDRYGPLCGFRAELSGSQSWSWRTHNTARFWCLSYLTHIRCV
uniref:Dynamin-type G domain-containing protein n=1 Tax=Cyprinus carpio carpio TaxID=630221 RepID=A0A9J7ZZ51_CYPCA